MRLVVTRPLADSERTAAALRARGHQVLVAPLMRVEPVAADLRGTWAAVIMTSANAPAAIAANPAREALIKLPAFAVGQRSADAARQAGFSNATAAGGDFAFNAGNALYRQKHYDKAAGRWRGTLGEARFRQRSAYNLGNAAVRSAEDATGPAKDSLLDTAVAAYEDALRLDPRDRDAKWNLEIALRRRGERPGGSSSGHSRHGDYGQGNQNVPGFQGNQEAAVGAMAGGGFGSGGDGESVKELDQTEARQLLDAVQREQLATHLGRRASHPTTHGRDW